MPFKDSILLISKAAVQNLIVLYRTQMTVVLSLPGWWFGLISTRPHNTLSLDDKYQTLMAADELYECAVALEPACREGNNRMTKLEHHVQTDAAAGGVAVGPHSSMMAPPIRRQASSGATTRDDVPKGGIRHPFSSAKGKKGRRISNSAPETSRPQNQASLSILLSQY